MILDNLNAVLERVEAAARRAGRDPQEVELVAITKKASDEDVRTLLSSGKVRWLGENRVQDAKKRREALGADAAKARWRFVGHLQTNKVNQALGLFDTIDSLDSLKLAAALDKRLATAGKELPVLVQVKLTDRDTQSGVSPEGLKDFLDRLSAFPRLKPSGVMAIAPMQGPLEAVRPYFRRLREAVRGAFAERLPNGERPRISSGMSRDFEIAIEEGADLVRIGTALFASSENDLSQTSTTT